MARQLPPLSIITAAFLLCSAPVHGRRGTSGGHTSLSFGNFWEGGAFGTAIVATILLGCLFIVSIQTFFMHLNKDPHHLFSQQPVGEANTGQLFCTLVVLGLSFLTAYFPLFIVFILIPLQNGMETVLPQALTYMTIYMGYALAAGALLALVSHRRYLHFGQEEGTLLWKKSLDLAIIGFMITFIAIWTALASTLPFTFESQTALDVLQAMEHLRVAFYYLATIDIFISAAFLWRRLKAAGIQDQAILDLCFGASFFFIALAIFNIIRDALKWEGHYFFYFSALYFDYRALIFFDTLINGVCGFFGLAWVLRVFWRKLGFCRF